VAPIQMILSDLEGHLLFQTFLGRRSTWELWHVCPWIGKLICLVMLTVSLKLKHFWRPRAVMYTVSVVISRKWCKIDLLLLQTT